MLTMANAQKTAAWLYGVIFVINLSLNLILIPTIGLLGAAIATALSMTIEAILLVIAVRHHLGVISFIGFAGHLEVKKGMREPQAVATPEVAS
jgi:O-antigen/teichoic acid export membrane protein